MEKKLRILQLEDVAADAELVLRELKKANIEFSAERVETKRAFVEGLENFNPDLILADYALPSFDGVTALSIAQKQCPDVPYIFVSGAIGEELAIETLMKGATDYVLKDRLSRLVPSIRQAFREFEERAARRRAEQALQKAHNELEIKVKERTAELQASEERTRTIVDTAADGIITIDEKGNVESVNNAAEKIFGYSAKEMLGQNIKILMPEPHHDEHDGYIKNYLKTGEKKIIGIGREVNGRRKDGSTFPMDIAVSEMRIGEQQMFTGIVRDITERKRAEEAVQESAKRLSHILESAMDAIITIDENQHILLFNEAAVKILRCSDREVINKTIDPFLSENFRNLLNNYLQESAQDKKCKPYIWLPEGLTAIRCDSEEFPIEGTISQVELSGQKLFTIILRDINDRLQAEAELDKLQRQNVYLQEELKSEYNFEEIVGASLPMKKVFKNIEMVANTDSTVLITGETGTGKELIARAVHNLSSRKDGVLVKVNSGSLPAGLVESELFGHEKGAFTGATNPKKGRFELADGGSIFLDEVGELPLETQIKLLRVLQEQEFERLGGTQTKKVNVRVIAATNRDLEEAVENGSFRADLFYRLNIFPIRVPSLIERMDDIPLLTNHFLEKFSRQMGKNVKSINPSIFGKLENYNWPGNVRELANILERAVILCGGGKLQPEHIGISAPRRDVVMGISSLDDAEKIHILNALEKTNGVVAGSTGAANLLGINRSTLLSRMRKFGIQKSDYAVY